MKALFDQVSAQCSQYTTRLYSTSFSLGIYFLHKKLREPIYGIYGFVRLTDEIVDSFEGYQQGQLLTKLKADTWEAIEQKISLNPILNAFQKVVNDYQIEHHLIETFLRSMEMDLFKQEYDKAKYDEYILGSAEVVGLMCLAVFTNGDKTKYEELKPAAMKLGSAFQKVNFLRDIKQDFYTLGRTYFPEVNIPQLTANEKVQIEKEIAEEFRLALIGIKKLPISSRGGVYLAYVYYLALFRKIRETTADKILSQRIRVNNLEKFRLMINSFVQTKLNLV